jgi:hypothetical protein
VEEFLRSIPAAGSIPYAFIAFAIAGLLFLLAAHDCIWLSCVLLPRVPNGLDQLIHSHGAFNRFF